METQDILDGSLPAGNKCQFYPRAQQEEPGEGIFKIQSESTRNGWTRFFNFRLFIQRSDQGTTIGGFGIGGGINPGGAPLPNPSLRVLRKATRSISSWGRQTESSEFRPIYVVRNFRLGPHSRNPRSVIEIDNFLKSGEKTIVAVGGSPGNITQGGHF